MCMRDAAMQVGLHTTPGEGHTAEAPRYASDE